MVLSARKERQVRGTAADGRHDGGRHVVADQVGRVGHDERQSADDQHAGPDVVRHTGVEETGVGWRRSQRHHVRSDQRAVTERTRRTRPVVGPRLGLRPAGSVDRAGTTALTRSRRVSVRHAIGIVAIQYLSYLFIGFVCCRNNKLLIYLHFNVISYTTCT